MISGTGKSPAGSPLCATAASFPSCLRIHHNVRDCREGRRRGCRPPLLVTATSAQVQDAEAVASQSPPQGPGSIPGKEKRRNRRRRLGQAEQESLELLGWPDLCKQVASFCQTPMGAQRAIQGRLPIGESLEESELLLRQTREAQAAGVDLKGLYDVRRAIDAAVAGQALPPLALGAIATALTAAHRVRLALESRGESTQALLKIAAGFGDALPELKASIERCINTTEGLLLDSATPTLESTRRDRRQNLDALRRTADEWARSLHASGAAERPQVVVRRDRQCIPVKAGRQAELPKGSVMLATSASGSTVYAEPAPLVSLNNSEAALAAAEQQEEDAVLAELSAAVAKEERALRRIVSVAAALDVACARGRHAAWVGGVEPRLHAASPDVAAVNISNARHPLLLEKSLPKLPTPPLPELPSAALDGVSGPMAAVKLVPELWGKVASKQPPSGPLPGSNGSVKSSTTSRTDASVSSGPVPVDLVVPPGKAVVAVTGPNTGGKTASLKTLGLLCLMTKAGLFVPVALNPAAPAGASSQPSIAWFDRVLADVGDGQSLQQSLSTFSGHIRRVKGVLKEATPASLVLLDEVGSGTDPAEGAALAVSLLSHLAQGRAALVYATTHHSELKEVAATHPGFINASVEFDIKTLKPTYRLMWGLAGESNALAVAQGLGFDARVVDDARAVAARLQSGVKDAADKVMQLTQSLEQQHVEAVRAAGEIARRHRAAEKELHAAEAELAAEEAAREKLQSGNSSAKDATEAAKKEVQQILARVKAGEMSPSEAEALLRKVEQRAQAGNAAAMALAGAKLGGDLQGDAFSTEDSSDGWVPNAGDHVRVLKMGGAIGVVASAGRSGGGKVAVRVGAMTVEVRVSDLAPSTDAPLNVSNEAPGAKKASQGMADMKALREGLKAKGGARSGTQPAELGGSPLGVAVQTQRNTVNMRGLSSVDAVAKLEVALSDARPGSVLFAVHGVGTGRVRAAALDMLKRHPVVAKIEEAENSNGGCTVVYLLA